MRFAGWALVIVILAARAAADPICTSGVVWNYCRCGDCAVNGPANWGTLGAPNWPECSGGTIPQSPAKLAPPVYRDLGRLILSYQSMKLTMKNTGRAIKIIPTAPQFITIKDGPRLFLDEFHFHIPAEHTLPGVEAVAELHLVHGGDKGSVPTAIAVLIVQSSEPNPELVPIVSAASTVPMCDQRATTSRIELQKLVPKSLAASFLEYDGSLTTPPCTRVRWLVLDSTISISGNQLAKLNLFGANARPTISREAVTACWPVGPNCKR